MHPTPQTHDSPPKPCPKRPTSRSIDRGRLATIALLSITLAATACEGTIAIGGPDGSGTNPGGPGAAADVEPSLHRLNRLEYNNSVRDLLGTSLTPADTFPPDASVGGFDNISAALSITPALMDRYVDAAHTVVDDAFADRPAFSDRLEENDSPALLDPYVLASRLSYFIRSSTPDDRLLGAAKDGTLSNPRHPRHRRL